MSILVNSGNSPYYISSGTDYGDIVVNGGSIFVLSGAVTDATSVGPAGSLTIDFGGSAGETFVSSGGSAAVYGSASGTQVGAGGIEGVLSGGVDNGTTLFGGAEIVVSGGAVSGTVTFVGSGELVLDQSSDLSGDAQLAGFNSPSDILDLRDISFTGLQSIQWTQTAPTTGTLTVADATHVAKIALLGEYNPENFTVASDGSGGTFVSDPTNTFVFQQLPIDVVGDPGSEQSLASILTAALGPNAGGYSKFWLAYEGASYLQSHDFNYWDPNAPILTTISENGTVIPASAVGSFNQTLVTSAQLPSCTLNLGNVIAPLVFVTVPVSTGGGTPTEYIQYEINVVAPGLQAATAGDGEPNPSDIVAAAYRFAAAYTGVLNDNDCTFIAEDVAASAGATLDDVLTESTNPALNMSAGFWRVVYRGSDPNPVADWQTLVQPGDVVRMAWAAGGQHATTVLSVNADDSITVFDNGDRNGFGQEDIGIHTVNDDLRTIASSVTIFRLSPDHLYLISGIPNEKLNGTISYNNEFDAVSGDVVHCGPKNDVANVGSGNITIYGGGGTDSAIFAGAFSTYSIQVSGGAVVVSSSDGIDTLSGVTFAEFAGNTSAILPGTTVSGETIGSGSTQITLGAESGAVISKGGSECIGSGGTGDSDTVAGLEIINSGGFGFVDVVAGGGTLSVTSGGTAANATVSSAGLMVVSSGGLADPTTICAGGSEVVNVGGTDLGAVVSGGRQVVFGAASGVTIYAGQQQVKVGGLASGTVVSGGVLNDFGSASAAQIKTGGSEVVQSGGAETGATVSNGGIEIIEPHGLANALTVLAGGVAANSGGSASGAVVWGQDILGSGSVETSAVLQSGGTEFIVSGATALGLTILSGGVAANSGGSASGTTVDTGGLDFVQSGSVETGATLPGGIEYINSGGRALGLVVLSGGVAANFGGSASGTIVDNGGLDYLEPGAVETAGVLSNGGIEFIEAGGTTLGLTVSSGGVVANFGGSASGTMINAGGFDYLESGSVETGATISNGGIEYIEAGGTALGLMVLSGGIVANFGGSASGTIVSGQDYLEAGAVETGTSLASGGQEIISAGAFVGGLAVGINATVAIYGGSASGTIVSSGGHGFLEAGAVETSATINRFGAEFIASGATAIGVTDSGLVNLASGGVISGTVTFGPRGQLQLADSQDFTNLVAGFSGVNVRLDLQDITYVASGATATTINWTQLTTGASASGTLTVSQGGHAANITLLGQYATDNFIMSGDAGAGTMVIDPPLAGAGSATLFVNPRH